MLHLVRLFPFRDIVDLVDSCDSSVGVEKGVREEEAMWTEAKTRRNKRLRKELSIAAASGYAAATNNVGEWQAQRGGAFSGGKIVIAGWTGEHFVTSQIPRKPTAAAAPAGARRLGFGQAGA